MHADMPGHVYTHLDLQYNMLCDACPHRSIGMPFPLLGASHSFMGFTFAFAVLGLPAAHLHSLPVWSKLCRARGLGLGAHTGGVCGCTVSTVLNYTHCNFQSMELQLLVYWEIDTLSWSDGIDSQPLNTGPFCSRACFKADSLSFGRVISPLGKSRSQDKGGAGTAY